jgi:MscS family membrane protein
VVWALLLLNAVAERHIYRRLRDGGHPEVGAMLRVGRRGADALVIATGVLVVLHYFGIDATAALAGLGIGGIAVALAAQKTLENVMGGLSIIFDGAVRTGDFLKLGETCGTVDYIGLRSTRIRTLDRTVLSVPNGQIANANIETLSARDKFWFHHVVGLRYETTAAQMRVVVNAIRAYLTNHPMVDPSEPIRVRFFRFGPFSLDIEVFAYLSSSDWDAFLETQQELLLEVMDIVDRGGAGIALPSQTLHLAKRRDIVPDARPEWRGAGVRLEARHPTTHSA